MRAEACGAGYLVQAAVGAAGELARTQLHGPLARCCTMYPFGHLRRREPLVVVGARSDGRTHTMPHCFLVVTVGFRSATVFVAPPTTVVYLLSLTLRGLQVTWPTLLG